MYTLIIDLFLIAIAICFAFLGKIFFSILFGWVAIGVFCKWIAPKIPRSLQNLAQVIQVICLEPLALIGVYALSFLSFQTGPFSLKKSKTPILMIHGYINFASVWLYHRIRLQRKGFGPIYTINLGSPFNSIETYAKKVKQKVKEIEKETKRRDLILIGHSMGGLVATIYAIKYGKEKVRGIITLGSPLRGTKMAKIGIGECAKQMERDSLFIKNLKRKLPEHLYYHVVTKRDQLVIPYKSGLVNNDRERKYVLDDVGHASLLYSTRVTSKIAKWLKQISS